MNYDFIATGRAVNKTAGRTLTKGEHFEPKAKRQETYYMDKIPLKTKKYKGPVEFDITDKAFGDLVCVGYIGRPGNKKRSGVWLFKCKCGNYIKASSKGIQKREIYSCDECEELDYLKKQHSSVKGLNKG